MTQEFENQLKQMFAGLDEDLPAGQFAPRVMSELLRPRRREGLLWSGLILATLAFLGFSFAKLGPELRILAGVPHTLIDAANESGAALSQSPLVHIYGMALGACLLLCLMRRLGIRVM
jgi:hypothetical protein